MKCIFILTGHSEPDWGGASAGPDQLLPQLHGAHQAAKEKVRLTEPTQQLGHWLLKPPGGHAHTSDPHSWYARMPNLLISSDLLKQNTCPSCVEIKLKHFC